MTWTNRRPAAVIVVSLLQLFIHVLINCRDVRALTNVDHIGSAAKSVSRPLVRQLRQSSTFANNDRMLTTRQRRSSANDDEAVALDGGENDVFGGPFQYDEKRKWAKNTVRVWGKRGVIDRQYVDEDAVDGALDKRTWSKNKVRVWGKRFADADADGLPGQWAIQNGAGSDDYDALAAAEAKRRWSDNRVRVWGKRDHDDTGRLLQSSNPDSVADRQKYAGESRQVVTALANELGRNLTVGGERQRGNQQRGLSSRRTSTTEGINDGNEVSDVLRQRAAIVKRAIDDSAGDADELAWISDERLSRPVYYGSSSPSSFFRGRWMTTGVKRAGAGAYGGGGSSVGGAGGRFPFLRW